MTEEVDKPLTGSAATMFKKGQTGNPLGRPRKDKIDNLDDLRRIESMLRKAAPEAAKILIKNMKQATTPELQVKMATLVIDKMVVMTRELDRKEDRSKGITPSTQEDDSKPKPTRVSFTLAVPEK